MSLRNPNPALESGFGGPDGTVRGAGADVMTTRGTVNKLLVLLGVIVTAAAGGWQLVNIDEMVAYPAALASIVATIVLAVFIARKPDRARHLAIPYAAIEGIVVGVISRIYADGNGLAQKGAEATGGGIIVTATGLTIAITVVLALIYRTGVVNVTKNFRLGVIAATGGIAVFYIVALALGIFGVQMPLIWDASPIGIGFSVLVVILAAANLVLDFDFVERGVEAGYPKSYEWFGAFGLTVTIVWLYLELLRLLAKLQSRD